MQFNCFNSTGRIFSLCFTFPLRSPRFLPVTECIFFEILFSDAFHILKMFEQAYIVRLGFIQLDSRSLFFQKKFIINRTNVNLNLTLSAALTACVLTYPQTSLFAQRYAGRFQSITIPFPLLLGIIGEGDGGSDSGGNVGDDGDGKVAVLSARIRIAEVEKT